MRSQPRKTHTPSPPAFFVSDMVDDGLGWRLDVTWTLSPGRLLGLIPTSALFFFFFFYSESEQSIPELLAILYPSLHLFPGLCERYIVIAWQRWMAAIIHKKSRRNACCLQACWTIHQGPHCCYVALLGLHSVTTLRIFPACLQKLAFPQLFFFFSLYKTSVGAVQEVDQQVKLIT